MSRRVIVKIPTAAASTPEGRDVSFGNRPIVASFTLAPADDATATVAPLVEIGGTLAPPLDSADAFEQDSFVVPFAAACTRASRTMPSGLHVRATYRAPITCDDVPLAALALGSAAAANALLTLRLSPDDLVSVVTLLGHDKEQTVKAITEQKLTVRHDCDDVPSTQPSGQL